MMQGLMKKKPWRNNLRDDRNCRGAVVLPNAAGAQGTPVFPLASSRVGPFSAMGTGYYGAQIDYMNYINMNGGV